MKKISNSILTIIIILFAFCLLFFSESNILAVQSSINLCLNSIFPSLFPFLIVSNLLSYTTVISFLSSKLERLMKLVFKMPGISAYPFVLGIISGYPVGAKIVSNLREEKKISKSEGNTLLIFTNNAGPLFIIGTVGYSIYSNVKIGFLLLVINIVSAIFTGFIFSHISKNQLRSASDECQSELSFSSLGEIIGSSIKNSFYTLSTVCGFVILFALIISIIKSSGILSIFNNKWIECVILGILEITTGINLASQIVSNNIVWNLALSAFFIGTGRSFSFASSLEYNF